MSKYVLRGFLLCMLSGFSCVYAQKERKFGNLNQKELNYIATPTDSISNAVVLYERGDNYFDIIYDKLRLVKKYHGIIKILNTNGLREGNIDIGLYKNKKYGEKLNNLKAVTHNGSTKTFVSEKAIFKKDINENWVESSFAFSNIKPGSILEYSYEIITPFFYNFSGWNFQSHLPKLHSEFNAKIPSNFRYNRALVGSLKLETNEASIKKKCFHVPGIAQPADCEILKYIITDIPAFYEDEPYMLAESNYLSSITFELSEQYNFSGSKNKYTKSWEDVDREFKHDKDIGQQLGKKPFFEKKLKEDFNLSGSPEEQAKQIYYQFRDRMTWNGKYSLYRNSRTKAAYENKSGNVGEINIALANLLNAAGFTTNLILSSTRNNGLPKKIHPVISDFNYLLIAVSINNKDYILDATQTYLPFGMLPFKTLNYYGRLMDFKKGSSWIDLDAYKKNTKYIRTSLKIDLQNNLLSGKMGIYNTGYFALSKKRLQNESTEEDYIENLENTLGDHLSISGYKAAKKTNTPYKSNESFTISIEDFSPEETIYLNPFLITFFDENPFKRPERNFPIDFGFKRTYTYLLNLQIPQGYIVEELPKSENISLPDKQGFYILKCEEKNKMITLSLSFKLNHPHFAPILYPHLKELFNKLVSVQKNSLIVLKKQP